MEQFREGSTILVVIFWNLLYELHNELPNDLRLRILGNKEIFEKSHIGIYCYNSIETLSGVKVALFANILNLSIHSPNGFSY